MSASAADRVILDRQALAPLSAAACRTGSVILAAKPIASHRAEGERRESWPGRSGCRRCPRSGFRAGDGISPGSSNGPEPGRRPCPGTPWRSRPPRPRPPGRRRIRLPGASILYLGITLSDERGEGERAHCRRDGRSARPECAARDGRRSVCSAWSAVAEVVALVRWSMACAGSVAVWNGRFPGTRSALPGQESVSKCRSSPADAVRNRGAALRHQAAALAAKGQPGHEITCQNRARTGSR